MSSGLTPGQQALLAQRLRGRPAGPALPAAPPGRVPLSAEQEQLLHHSWFAPAVPLYNEVVTVRKDGPLDAVALRTAFAQLVARHSAWRTTFHRRPGGPHQVVHDSAEVPFAVVDLTDHPDPDGAAVELVRAQTLLPYDLATGPLVRPLLVRFSEQHHRLYLSLHHLVFDGVSLHRVVLPELVALHDAAAAGVPAGLPPPVQYVDHASWQRGGALQADVDRHLPFWRTHLDGAPTLSLPLAAERPPARPGHGTTAWFTVPDTTYERLRDRARATDRTLFQLLVAAWALLLHELTGDTELVLATVADLRRRPELETVLGYCVTPVPLRLTVDPAAPFDQLVSDARAELLDVLGHLLPLSALVDALNPAHPAGANPFFQATIVLEPAGRDVGGGWRLDLLDRRTGDDLAGAKSDLHLEVDEGDGGLSGRLVVTTDLFAPEFAAETVGAWVALLDRLGRQPVASPTATSPSVQELTA